jgi:hypothetical protein
MAVQQIFLGLSESLSFLYQDYDTDFTIEWFQYTNTTQTSYPRIFSVGVYPNTSIGVSIESGTFYFWYGGNILNGNMQNINFVPQGIENTWVHFAIVRNSGIIKIYQNGVLQLSQTMGTNYIMDSSEPLWLGGDGLNPNGLFNGYITNFHIVKGFAVYTSDFTPPVTQLIPLPTTVLLLLGDPSGSDSSGYYHHTESTGSNWWSAESPFSPAGVGSYYFDGSTIQITPYVNASLLNSGRQGGDVDWAIDIFPRPPLLSTNLILDLDTNNGRTINTSSGTLTDISSSGLVGNVSTGQLLYSPPRPAYVTYANQFVDFGDFGGTSSAFDFGITTFTINFWINPNTWGLTSAGVIEKRTSNGSGWTIYNDTSSFAASKINLRFADQLYLTSTNNVQIGVWQNWTLVRTDSTTFVWYLNGLLDNVLTTGTSPSATDLTAHLVTGHTSTWDGYYDGLMGPIQIYNTSLTATDVKNLFYSYKIIYGI